MKIIALDPGKRTGYCESDDYGFSLSYRAVLDQTDVVDRLWSIQGGEVIVIYENFMVYSDKASSLIMQELFAPETIGMIKAIAQLKGWKVHTQWAAAAKSSVSDQLLVKRGYILNSKNVVGINNSSEVRHAKDAARHLLHFVDFAKIE